VQTARDVDISFAASGWESSRVHRRFGGVTTPLWSGVTRALAKSLASRLFANKNWRAKAPATTFRDSASPAWLRPLSL
jgi:hypothetical protein